MLLCYNQGWGSRSGPVVLRLTVFCLSDCQLTKLTKKNYMISSVFWIKKCSGKHITLTLSMTCLSRFGSSTVTTRSWILRTGTTGSSTPTLRSFPSSSSPRSRGRLFQVGIYISFSIYWYNMPEIAAVFTILNIVILTQVLTTLRMLN